jgi:hypothetical protein
LGPKRGLPKGGSPAELVELCEGLCSGFGLDGAMALARQQSAATRSRR